MDLTVRALEEANKFRQSGAKVLTPKRTVVSIEHAAAPRRFSPAASSCFARPSSAMVSKLQRHKSQEALEPIGSTHGCHEEC